MYKLTFDKESHTYRVNSVQLVSVTQVISASKDATDYSHIPRWILDRAAQIGDIVHGAVYNHYGLTGHIITNDESARKYLEGFRDYLIHEQFEAVLSEKLMWCKCHMLAGTVDLVGHGPRGLTVRDVKTTNKINQASVELQTAAYQHLVDFGKIGMHLDLPEIEARDILHLTKRGTYDIIPCEDEEAWARYEELVESYWNEKGGKPCPSQS